MNPNLNKYREPDRTLVVDVAANLVALHTNQPLMRQKLPTLITASDNFTTTDVSLSTEKFFDLPMSAVTKILMVSAAHRFIIMHRDTELDEFRLLAVCNGLFVQQGVLMGQIRLIGDYEEAIRCTVVYA
jgi:hypothetical protein